MFVEYLVEVCLTCCKSYRLPFIFITIYGVVCVQLAHFSIGFWKDISIAHVIIIIKSEVSTFPIVIMFSVVVCLRCLLHHILSLIAYTFRENREYILSSVWVTLSIFSQWSIIQYVGLCVFSLPTPFVMIERIYILCLIIIIKSEYEL